MIKNILFGLLLLPLFELPSGIAQECPQCPPLAHEWRPRYFAGRLDVTITGQVSPVPNKDNDGNPTETLDETPINLKASATVYQQDNIPGIGGIGQQDWVTDKPFDFVMFCPYSDYPDYTDRDVPISFMLYPLLTEDYGLSTSGIPTTKEKLKSYYDAFKSYLDYAGLSYTETKNESGDWVVTAHDIIDTPMYALSTERTERMQAGSDYNNIKINQSIQTYRTLEGKPPSLVMEATEVFICRGGDWGGYIRDEVNTSISGDVPTENGIRIATGPCRYVIEGELGLSDIRFHTIVPLGQVASFDWTERQLDVSSLGDAASIPAGANVSHALPGDPLLLPTSIPPGYSYGNISDANPNNGTITPTHNAGFMQLVGSTSYQLVPIPGLTAAVGSYASLDPWSQTFSPMRDSTASGPVDDTKHHITIVGNGQIQHTPWMKAIKFKDENNQYGQHIKYTIVVPLYENSTCHACELGKAKVTPDQFTVDAGPSPMGLGSDGKLLLHPKALLDVSSDGIDEDCYLSETANSDPTRTYRYGPALMWAGHDDGALWNSRAMWTGSPITGRVLPRGCLSVDSGLTFDEKNPSAYTPASVPTKSISLWRREANDMVRWDFAYEDSPAKKVTITQNVPNQNPETFSYSYNGTDYTVTTPGQKIVTTYLPGNIERVTTMDSQGNVSEVVDYYYDFLYRIGKVLISKVVDPGDGKLNLTTTYSYYDATEAGEFARLRQVEGPDGSWTRYYWTDGQISREVRGKGNTLAPSLDSEPSGPDYIVTDYNTSALYGGSPVGGKVTVDDSVIALTDVQQGPNGASITQSPTSDGTAASKLRSSVTTCTEGIAWTLGHPRLIERADGTRAVHFYEFAGMSAVVETILDGEPDPSNPVNVIKGTRTVVVQRTTGEEISRTVYMVPENVIIKQDIGSNFDSMFRPQMITHLDGSFENITYSCCGVETITRSDGTSTTYTYDARKRVQTETQRSGINSVTYWYTYDASDRLLTVSRAWNKEAFALLKSCTYDGAGRIKTVKDEVLGITTKADYSPDCRTVTITTPTLATKVLQYNRDGSIDAITGTGAAPYSRKISVENLDSINRLVIQEFATSDKDTSKFWKKTYFDGAMRPIKTVSLAGDAITLTYNSKGQLAKTEDADHVRSIRTYDSLGLPQYQTIKDLKEGNSTDDIEPDGTTPLSKKERFVSVADAIAGETVVCERELVWPTKNSSASRTQKETRISLDGLRKWVTIYNDAYNRADTWKSITRYDTTAGEVSTTNTEPAGNYSYRITKKGLLAEEGSYNDGLCTDKRTYTYDAHNRLKTITDARNNKTTITYNTKDQIIYILQPESITYGFNYDSLGRLWGVTRNGYNEIQKTYDSRNRVIKEAGSVYQVGYQYDDYGRLTGVTNWGSGIQVTSFEYNEVTGRLAKKVYPEKSYGAGRLFYQYQYTDAGRLWKITDPRTITSTASYTLGIQTGLEHSDGSTTISTILNRLGQPETLTFGDQITAFTYGNAGDVRSETYSGQGPLAGFSVQHTVNPQYQAYDTSLRDGVNAVLTSTTKGYIQGRLTSESFSPGEYYSNLLTLDYLPNSDLVNAYTTPAGTQQMGYDNAYRVTSANMNGVESHTYHYNVRGQRDTDTLLDGSKWSYGYDGLHQLTYAGKRTATGDSDITAPDANFYYDNIGNTYRGPDPGNVASLTSNIRNNLNQLTVLNHSPSIFLSGEADPTASLRVTGPYFGRCDATRQGNKFAVNYPFPARTTNDYIYLTNKATLPAMANLPGAFATNVLTVFRPAGSAENLTYDDAGNLYSDGRWIYTWDAYNRLTKMQSKDTDPEPSRRQIQFTYDAGGRRIARSISVWKDGNYKVVDSRKFIYDGWNLIAELNAAENNAILRTYGWVGNRLASIRQGNSVYTPVLDGNGNVMALVNQNTKVVEARYEYGAFGILLKVSGSMALENPLRYSSQYQDDVTGLIYYGYRYFNPSTQGWLSRDPIGFPGGFNLYGFVNNDPINKRDFFGLAPTLAEVLKLTQPTEVNIMSPEQERMILSPGNAVKGDLIEISKDIDYANEAWNQAVDNFWGKTKLLPPLRNIPKFANNLNPIQLLAVPGHLCQNYDGMTDSNASWKERGANALAGAFELAMVMPIGGAKGSITAQQAKQHLLLDGIFREGESKLTVAEVSERLLARQIPAAPEVIPLKIKTPGDGGPDFLMDFLSKPDDARKAVCVDGIVIRDKSHLDAAYTVRKMIQELPVDDLTKQQLLNRYYTDMDSISKGWINTRYFQRGFSYDGKFVQGYVLEADDRIIGTRDALKW